LDLYLKHRGSRWRAPVLAVAVGIYLPLTCPPPFWPAASSPKWSTAGMSNTASAATRAAQTERHVVRRGAHHGEALVGIFIAMCIGSARTPMCWQAPPGCPGGKWWRRIAAGDVLLDFRAGTPRRAA